jgi:hypothetical protein
MRLALAGLSLNSPALRVHAGAQIVCPIEREYMLSKAWRAAFFALSQIHTGLGGYELGPNWTWPRQGPQALSAGSMPAIA